MQLPRRAAGLTAAAALLAVGAVLLASPPVGAARLSVASPADGTRLGAVPAAVTLTFSADVGQAHVEVTGASTGGVQVAGRTVTQPITAAGAGPHQVSWHVVTGSGRELSGSLAFTVGSGPAVAAAEPPSGPPTGHQHGGPDPLSGALLGVNVLVVAVLGVLFVRTGRRRRAAAAQ